MVVFAWVVATLWLCKQPVCIWDNLVSVKSLKSVIRSLERPSSYLQTCFSKFSFLIGIVFFPLRVVISTWRLSHRDQKNCPSPLLAPAVLYGGAFFPDSSRFPVLIIDAIFIFYSKVHVIREACGWSSATRRWLKSQQRRRDLNSEPPIHRVRTLTSPLWRILSSPNYFRRPCHTSQLGLHTIRCRLCT